jgi:hypothetical protein
MATLFDRFPELGNPTISEEGEGRLMMFDTQLDFDTTDAAQKRRNEEITTALRDFLATMPGTIVLRTRTGRELHLSQR